MAATAGFMATVKSPDEGLPSHARRDMERLMPAYRVVHADAMRIELVPSVQGKPACIRRWSSSDASPWLDQKLSEVQPLGWHAWINLYGAIRLECQPDDKDLLHEAFTLLHRISAHEELPLPNWDAMDYETRKGAVHSRLLLKFEAAQQLGRRVEGLLTQLYSDRLQEFGNHDDFDIEYD